MSTTHQYNDAYTNCDDDVLINLWENEGHVGMSEDMLSNTSDKNLTMTLSMTEVALESDDNDESISVMSDINDDIDKCGWDGSSGKYLVWSRSSSKLFPSFYGDDDEDDDYESFDDYSEDSDHESGDNNSTSHVSIRTPPQDDLQALMFRNDHRFPNRCEVMPEPPANLTLPTTSVPLMSDVKLHVKRTLQKLACSMRRSDETRTFLKRQRLQYLLNYPRSIEAINDEKTDLKDGKDRNDVAADVTKSAKHSTFGMEQTQCCEYDNNDVEMGLDRRKVYHVTQMGLRATSSNTMKSNLQL
jgi:hypothetical protein